MGKPIIAAAAFAAVVVSSAAATAQGSKFDGRWSIDEKQLASPPSEGDLVMFDGYGDWRVQGSERVGAKPSGKRSREFFVCAPSS